MNNNSNSHLTGRAASSIPFLPYGCWLVLEELVTFFALNSTGDTMFMLNQICNRLFLDTKEQDVALLLKFLNGGQTVRELW